MIILGVPNKQLSANQFVNWDTMQKRQPNGNTPLRYGQVDH